MFSFKILASLAYFGPIPLITHKLNAYLTEKLFMQYIKSVCGYDSESFLKLRVLKENLSNPTMTTNFFSLPEYSSFYAEFIFHIPVF